VAEHRGSRKKTRYEGEDYRGEEGMEEEEAKGVK
jgi:hypothetical protein